MLCDSFLVFQGLIDSVNSKINIHMSKWKSQKGNMLKIDKENREIHERISKAVSIPMSYIHNQIYHSDFFV